MLFPTSVAEKSRISSIAGHSILENNKKQINLRIFQEIG
jgi:hypothetical protein